MTKKHFIELANLIKARQWDRREGAGLFIHDLADFCADQNPRFNRERWLDYLAGRCGPNGGKLDVRCSRCSEADRTRGDHGLGRCVSFSSDTVHRDENNLPPADGGADYRLAGHIRGWNIGARVEMDVDPETGFDRVTVYRTAGSSGGGSSREVYSETFDPTE